MKHSGKQQQEMQRKEKKGGVLVNGEGGSLGFSSFKGGAVHESAEKVEG